MRPARSMPLAALLGFALGIGLAYTPATAQRAPSPSEIAAYQGLHAAAARNHAGAVPELVTNGLAVDSRDSNGRTPLHVAAFLGHADAMRALVKAGANPNALDNQKYDIVTILAVNDDVPNLKVALSLGASAKNMTSPYDGTALIAAAHLGHDGIVKALIAAGAPLDHINNLKWTALIESIVLGQGGPRHVETLRALVAAGANVNLADGNGQSPLTLARSRGYTAMVDILTKAGAK
ncbi:MAG: ankyrin repeat domain-containing protein [Beijerinckiaceae bacterium]